MNLDPKDVQYDSIDVSEYKDAQNEEILEPYYSEIVHNNNSDSGYTMKPNISYSTLQITNTTISSRSLLEVYTSHKSSVKIPVAL